MSEFSNIKINAAIYPVLMHATIGKSVNENNKQMEPELSIALPQGAYLLYLQSIADDHNAKELDLLKKYAYGQALDDTDYFELLSLIMTPVQRNRLQSINPEDFLSPFGISIEEDTSGKKKFVIVEDRKGVLRAEAWEGILLDILCQSAMDVISCFDFEANYTEKENDPSDDHTLHISLGGWKFSGYAAEQKLSNSLRSALMFTLAGYCFGDRKNQYNSFLDYFESEFYKRVSLVFGIWTSIPDKTTIKYVPLYDSFYNLSASSKNDLRTILKAVLDNDAVAIDEKQTLKNQLISSAEEFHANISSADIQLEENLIKPAINFVLLREKAKETMDSAEILLTQDKYMDCANRCYYAMMFALKTLLEHQGKLANWKSNELKEHESHGSLDKGFDDLVISGILDASDKADFEYIKDQRWKCDYSLYCFTKKDAKYCVDLIKKFFVKVESIIG